MKGAGKKKDTWLANWGLRLNNVDNTVKTQSIGGTFGSTVNFEKSEVDLHAILNSASFLGGTQLQVQGYFFYRYEFVPESLKLALAFYGVQENNKTQNSLVTPPVQVVTNQSSYIAGLGPELSIVKKKWVKLDFNLGPAWSQRSVYQDTSTMDHSSEDQIVKTSVGKIACFTYTGLSFPKIFDLLSYSFALRFQFLVANAADYEAQPIHEVKFHLGNGFSIAFTDNRIFRNQPLVTQIGVSISDAVTVGYSHEFPF